MSKKISSSGAAADAVPRARGRPRAFDRVAALAIATRQFWQKGYEATSIADLTEAMGIGSPSLYATFGSKDALYAEALQYYRDQHESLAFAGFLAADTAREAVAALLSDTATGLTSGLFDVPYGCMVTLSSVGSGGHDQLAEQMRSARLATLEKLKARLSRAQDAGELPPEVDIHALARFVQSVQSGMSILARDGAHRAELLAVAELAMLGWDARLAAHAPGKA